MPRAKGQKRDKRRARELSVEELERRIALSVPEQKKTPVPAPYPPNADYGLLCRANLRKQHA